MSRRAEHACLLSRTQPAVRLAPSDSAAATIDGDGRWDLLPASGRWWSRTGGLVALAGACGIADELSGPGAAMLAARIGG